MLKCGVLVRLKVSSLSSALNRSDRKNLLISDMSRFQKPGPLNVFRPALPNVAVAGIENTLLSSHCLPGPMSPMTTGVPLMFALWLFPGAFSPEVL